ncbi:MAG: patatin-like phospholipase family protein [Bacteroidales bacterium]|nr:patatin-like phospholipase family protein [Bacteroidales bacterium]
MNSRKYNVGIVLSGGAARGFTHLGVLKALEEFNMKPNIISGVSSGAIAGALYADGYQPEEILEIYSMKSIFELVQITVPKTGIFKTSGLKDTLKKHLRATTFEQLQIPLVITATNLLEGKSEYFQKGNLVDAILASSSVPVLFESITINKIPYVDGGVMNNMPVEPIAKQCNTLIGVYINPTGPIPQLKGMVHIAERSFHLAIASEMNTKRHLFDIYIEPAEITNYSLFDLKKSRELFDVGYRKTVEVLNATSSAFRQEETLTKDRKKKTG